MTPIFPANPAERVGFYGGRIAQGLWGEPLNVVSDLCFLIVIIVYFIKLHRAGFSDKPILFLFMLGGLIGLGSTIFHAYPTRVTLRIDLLPITVFGLSYIFFSLRRYFNRSYTVAGSGTLVFLLFSLGFETAVKSLRIPGLHHIPSIAALTIMGALLLRNHLYNPAGKAFLLASGSYIVALFFRYLDFHIYPSFPLGTHFLWHVFTSCVVLILLYAAVTYGRINSYPPATE